jgi:hypothetical protein
MAATDGRVAGILDEHSAAIGVVFVEDRGTGVRDDTSVARRVVVG